MGLEDLLDGVLRDAFKKNQPPEMPRLPDPAASSPEELHGVARVMRSVVQVVALKQGFLGGMSSAWTGSGSIVDSSGVILTNCHVANPRAMGMSAPEADRLGIAITERSDQPPAITYYAQLVGQLPELDLACLLYTSPSPRDKRQSRMPSSA